MKKDENQLWDEICEENEEVVEIDGKKIRQEKAGCVDNYFLELLKKEWEQLEHCQRMLLIKEKKLWEKWDSGKISEDDRKSLVEIVLKRGEWKKEYDFHVVVHLIP